MGVMLEHCITMEPPLSDNNISLAGSPHEDLRGSWFPYW